MCLFPDLTLPHVSPRHCVLALCGPHEPRLKEEMHCQILGGYASTCQEAGSTLGLWREQTHCGEAAPRPSAPTHPGPASPSSQLWVLALVPPSDLLPCSLGVSTQHHLPELHEPLPSFLCHPGGPQSVQRSVHGGLCQSAWLCLQRYPKPASGPMRLHQCWTLLPGPGRSGQQGREGCEGGHPSSWPFSLLQQGESFLNENCSQRCTCVQFGLLQCQPHRCRQGEICSLGNLTRGCFRGEPRVLGGHPKVSPPLPSSRADGSHSGMPSLVGVLSSVHRILHAPPPKKNPQCMGLEIAWR